MYNAMILEKMGVFELQTRTATLNHISWDFLIAIKTCPCLPATLGVLSLIEFTRLRRFGPFSALLTHLHVYPYCSLPFTHVGFLLVPFPARAASQYRTSVQAVPSIGKASCASFSSTQLLLPLVGLLFPSQSVPYHILLLSPCSSLLWHLPQCNTWLRQAFSSIL